VNHLDQLPPRLPLKYPTYVDGSDDKGRRPDSVDRPAASTLPLTRSNSRSDSRLSKYHHPDVACSLSSASYHPMRAGQVAAARPVRREKPVRTAADDRRRRERIERCV